MFLRDSEVGDVMVNLDDVSTIEISCGEGNEIWVRLKSGERMRLAKYPNYFYATHALDILWAALKDSVGVIRLPRVHDVDNRLHAIAEDVRKDLIAAGLIQEGKDARKRD